MSLNCAIPEFVNKSVGSLVTVGELGTFWRLKKKKKKISKEATVLRSHPFLESQQPLETLRFSKVQQRIEKKTRNQHEIKGGNRREMVV